MSLLTPELREVLTEAAMGQLVEIYAKVRAKRDALKKKMEDQSNLLAEIGQIGLGKLAEAEVDSVRCDGFTAYRGERSSAVVKDKGEFREFLEQTGFWDLLETRASLEACKNYLAEHQGELPPGVDLSTITTFNVRKS